MADPAAAPPAAAQAPTNAGLAEELWWLHHHGSAPPRGGRQRYDGHPLDVDAETGRQLWMRGLTDDEVSEAMGWLPSAAVPLESRDGAGSAPVVGAPVDTDHQTAQAERPLLVNALERLESQLRMALVELLNAQAGSNDINTETMRQSILRRIRALIEQSAQLRRTNGDSA